MNIDKKYYQEINENLTNTIQDTNIDAQGCDDFYRQAKRF